MQNSWFYVVSTANSSLGKLQKAFPELDLSTVLMQFLCGAVHESDIELGAQLQCRTVLYRLKYGGKLLSSIFGWKILDSGYVGAPGVLQITVLGTENWCKSCAGPFMVKDPRYGHHGSAEQLFMRWIMEEKYSHQFSDRFSSISASCAPPGAPNISSEHRKLINSCAGSSMRWTSS